MGRLIIDGNSFFEIDEECIKKKRIPSECGLDKYLKDEQGNVDMKYVNKRNEDIKKGDG